MKTAGLQEQLKETLQGLKGVKEAYIFGSYAKSAIEPHSDIDLLVVGNHRIMELQHKINQLQNAMDREINVVNIEGGELKKRLKNKDPFFLNIFKQKE